MPAFTVRLATSVDTAAVDALLARAYPRLLKADYPPSVLVTALPLISRAQPALLRSGRYFVAETDAGAVIGAGGWSRRRGGPGAWGEVRHLVTDDRHLRQGVARAIIDAVHRQACAAGARGMGCLSTRTAVPFYTAMGYEALGETVIDLRAGISFPAIAMQRLL